MRVASVGISIIVDDLVTSKADFSNEAGAVCWPKETVVPVLQLLPFRVVLVVPAFVNFLAYSEYR